MTVTSATRSVTYNGAGTTGPFTVPFYFLENDDLVVTRISAAGVETILVLVTDYSVTGAGNPAGGSVTTTVAVAGGEKLRIERIVDLQQPTIYPENSKFPAKSHEKALDKLTMVDQQLQGDIDRAPKFSKASGVTGKDFPVPADGQVIGWLGSQLVNTVLTATPEILPGVANAFLRRNSANTAFVAVFDVPSVREVDTLAALAAVTASEVTIGALARVKHGVALGGFGDGDFRVFSGTAVSNGLTHDGVVVVQNSAATITFVRKQWWENNEVDLRWYTPALDGTTDSATAITNWYTRVNALAALRGRCKAVVPDIGAPFQTSVPVQMGSGFILTGGGELACHDNMPQATNLLRTVSLTGGLDVYDQEYIELNNITLDGRNRNLTIGSLQGLVRIYTTRRVVIGDNVEAKNQQSHLLAFAGNGSLSMSGSNIHLHDWGHPSNGIVITGAANNGSGLIRLTVTSTATMATGNTRTVNGVEGVTNANGVWLVTVINATTVDLQGTTFSGIFSGTSGRISAGIDGGSAIICLPNPTDATVHGNVQIGEGVYIHNGRWNGIQMNATNYTIDGVRIHDTLESGIFARNDNSNSFDGIIKGCHIKNVRRAYIDSSGLVATSSRMIAQGNLIENCDNIGISITSEAADVHVSDNKVINGNDDAVMFPSGGGIVLRDAVAATGPLFVRIRGNTIRDIKGTKTAAHGIRAVSIAPGTTSNDIEITGNSVELSSAVPGNEISVDSSILGVRWTVRDNQGAPDLYNVAQRVVVADADGGGVSSRDTGKLYINTGATAIAIFSLPAAALGLRYGFYVADADGIRVIPAGGAAIRIGASVGTTNAQSITIGDVLWLFCNGTNWFAENWEGTWTVT